ncbi:sugar transporter ERD6-like 17 [Camellia sinensis]|uniref:sugar transporter ERD6-like 17 n=1 Tax=Camellia sinensis TaxID=4442 RepID=UPI001035BEBF|nr:sugar transporter ERD6-like 17 [Camellia sinensis]
MFVERLLCDSTLEEFLGDLALGFIVLRYQQTLAYIGEITPKNSRGAFTAVNQLMLTCGLSLVYFVGNVVTWRTLAIIGTIPSLAEVIGLFFIPESPRWLVKVGKQKELEASLRRLRGQNVDISQGAAEIRDFIFFPQEMRQILLLSQDYLELAQQLPKSSFIDMFLWKYAHSLTIGVGIVLLAILEGRLQFPTMQVRFLSLLVARLPLALQYWLLFRFHFPFWV